MTDDEIIKALEYCGSGYGNCYSCPYDSGSCITTEGESLLLKSALDLINRQKADIEQLKKDLMMCKLEKEMMYQVADEIKSVAIKDFAEQLKKRFYLFNGRCVVDVPQIDNLVKEITEVEK